MSGDRYTLGADVGGTAVKFAVTDAAGESLVRGEVRTDPAGIDGTLAGLAAAVREAASGIVLAGVGLACAGIVSPRTGRLGRAPNLPGWEGNGLTDAVRRAFGDLPVVVANDVNAALVGEARLGAGRGYADLVMIALGTGVGGAVMVDGRVLTGAHDGAGEIGHMILDPDGPQCTCGARGCLEAYAGSWALVRAAAERADAAGAGEPFRRAVAEAGGRLDPSALHGLAAAGDPDARDLLAAAGRVLGVAVANLVNILDPQRMIIGGGVARAGEYLLGPCRDAARSRIMSPAGRDVDLVPAELGPHAAALGAALLAHDGDPVP